MSEVKCPTCGKEDFSNENYMKRHHKLKHDESLVEKYECSVDGCDNKTRNPKFCSDECMSKARRQYEESECKNLECDEEVYKKEYCSRDCANSHTWRNRDNAAKRDEVREKLSEMRTGEKIHSTVRNIPKKHLKRYQNPKLEKNIISMESLEKTIRAMG